MAKKAGISGLMIEIDPDSVSRLKRAFTVLGETDAPFLRDALDKAGQQLVGAARSRAPGGIGSRVEYLGVRGTGAALRAAGRVKHPGARSMEFGRQWYYRGYRGRNVSSGQHFRSPKGQQARPYLGIIGGGAAIGQVAPQARKDIQAAIAAEWDRLGGAS